MIKNDKYFSIPVSQRRYSNYTETNYTVQCTSGEPAMGTVRLEVVNTNAGLSTASTSHTVQNRDGSVSYTAGTWLKAKAEPMPGYKFVQWQTNVGTTSGQTSNTNQNPYSFKLTKDTWLIARFEKSSGNGQQTRTVEVRWDGDMGQVNCSSPLSYGQADGEKTGSISVIQGDSITLTAAHNSGYHFVKWSGIPIAGKTTPTVQLNVNNNYNVRAIFAKDDNGGGGGGGDNDDSGHVIGETDDPPTPGTNGGGGNGGSGFDFTPPDANIITKAEAFAKKYWWAILIAIYLYYNSKKGGSK